MNDVLNVLWFTAVPAPYRLPAWEVLGRSVNLTIVLTGRQQANRPMWAPPRSSAYSVKYVRPRLASASSDSAFTGVPNVLAIDRLLRNGPDAVVVQAWGDFTSLIASQLARRRGIAAVGYYGSSHATRSRRRFVGRLRRQQLRSLDSVVSYGTMSTELLIADGVDPARVVTGLNAVDGRALAEDVAAIRAMLPSDTTTELHRFLYVGQLIDRKGADIAVQAMSDPRLEDARLLIVGDGPTRRGLEALARASGTAGRITFAGLVPTNQMAAVYAAAHTLVMPSRQEVWGLVANEALACGLHGVVSLTAGSAPDLDGQPGVFLTEPTVDACIEAMVTSKREWRGWIDAPPVLDIGPERLAGDINRALDGARRAAGARRSRR